MLNKLQICVSLLMLVFNCMDRNTVFGKWQAESWLLQTDLES